MYSLSELWIKNFRSYKNLHIKDIQNYGLTLISGSNGSGKTTVKLALEYLLTDSVSENIPVDEFTFNKEGNCELGCVLFDDEDNEIKIIKYRDHKKKKNSTILEVNGDSESFTENDRRQTQKNIEKLLGITKESLTISSVFSQNSISFPECKESDRKSIIYDVLDLHKYQEKSNKAKGKVKELEGNMNSLTIKRDIISDDISKIDDKINRLNEKSKDWEKERIKYIESAENEIEEIENKEVDDLKELKRNLKKFNKNIANSKNEIDELKNEVIEHEKENDSTEDNSKERNEFFTGYDLLKKNKIRMEFEISSLNKELNKVGDGVCPVLKLKCEQLIEKENEIKTEKEEELEYKNKEYDKLNIELNRCVEIEKEYNKADEELENNRKEKEDKIRDVNNKIRDLENNISLNSREILHIEELISKALKEEQDKEERIDRIKINIEKKKEEEDPYVVMVCEEQTFLDMKKEKSVDISKEIDTTNDDIRYWSFLARAYSKSGIPNMKIEGFLESLEIETNKILSRISDKIYVEIESQSKTRSGEIREKVGYSVHHPEKAVTNYHSYSGGERQRVRIADMMAFQSLLGRFNFMILDEVLELSLDSSGKDNIIALLKSKLSDVNSLFVISHDQEIKDGFNKFINVKKRNGVSEIEEE